MEWGSIVECTIHRALVEEEWTHAVDSMLPSQKNQRQIHSIHIGASMLCGGGIHITMQMQLQCNSCVVKTTVMSHQAGASAECGGYSWWWLLPLTETGGMVITERLASFNPQDRSTRMFSPWLPVWSGVILLVNAAAVLSLECRLTQVDCLWCLYSWTAILVPLHLLVWNHIVGRWSNCCRCQ